MARYYVRINHTVRPELFHSFIVDQSEDIDSVVDYAEMIRFRTLEEHKGAINILRVPSGNGADDGDLLDQYDAVGLIYVAKHVEALTPASRDFSGEGFCA